MKNKSCQLLSYTKVFFCFNVMLLAGLVLLSGCAPKNKQDMQIPPKPVQTATVIQKDVPIYIDCFGTLSALCSVDIKSQVTGQIQTMHFKEGQEVSKGDLLFSINPSQYQADLEKAEASLEKDLVELKLNQDTLQRNKSLVEKNLVSQQDYETYQTNVASAEAQIVQDKVSIKTAKINLDYCSIHSPIDGLTGKRQLDVGNIVTANSGPVLVNIKTIHPLYVDFSVAERDFFSIKKAMSTGVLKVEVIVEGDKEKNKYSGELIFLENSIDETTGTIFLRAKLPNQDNALWPGQFVKARLILGTENNALLVPYDSVRIGQQGLYMYAVTPDKKADLRTVTTGMREGDFIIVKQGVKLGETVVTVGELGLSPGVSVEDVTNMKKDSEQTGKDVSVKSAKKSEKKS
ncbi:MAG: efflux RND transporter periplasmic adaptor subunit [Candidatus Theseobacter exili]|nr:efflux RND transporter periplasmic adaptor subunit [Candidatus Theseobacter exili]